MIANATSTSGIECKLGKMKSDERRIWRQQAEALGWSHSSVMERAAHEPLTDAERFDRAYAFAREIGYTHVMRFAGRKAKPVRIE